MDGNGRWAEKLGKSRVYGHRAGHTAVLKTVRHALKREIKSLTLFAFSSENWRRPEREIKALMVLFYQAIKQNRHLFLKHQIRFQVIGDKSRFSQKLQQAIQELESKTENYQAMTLNIAANYGSKWDIVQATKRITALVKNHALDPDKITEDLFSKHLCLSEQKPVDLLIRTGGEQRISNYLLWQSAYAELYFVDTFWPQFNKKAFDDAITEFCLRTRKFGGLVDDK